MYVCQILILYITNNVSKYSLKGYVRKGRHIAISRLWRTTWSMRVGFYDQVCYMYIQSVLPLKEVLQYCTRATALRMYMLDNIYASAYVRALVGSAAILLERGPAVYTVK